ncbi:glycosyltransferase family 9 protein [Desulfocurvibacter africanus]|uniref:glycosyltransferase family 9 protein n=1 Tax=Desulfocurvibacter africanus TaxID=873 RepID=UPI000408BF2E|nr:glycosyltransferase family 9 protein [Desulfocurvibacter africanus]
MSVPGRVTVHEADSEAGHVIESTQAAVFRLSALGDVVLTTGVLDWWHRRHNLRFTVITREAFAKLFKHHPAVERVVGITPQGLECWFRTANELAKTYGDRMLVDLHGTGRSLLLASLWKGQVRRYPKHSLLRRLYRLGRFDWAGGKLARNSVPQRYAMALDTPPPSAEQLRPKIFLQERELAQARIFLLERGVSNGERPLAALHPYATHAAKAWPHENWFRLVDLLEDGGWDWIVIGQDRAPFLRDRAGARDLTGGSDLRGSCALLAACSVCVTGDSGPMHMATAVGTPVTALFGPTTRAWGFFPSGEHDVVLERALPCRPCSLHGDSGCVRGRECLAAITPEEVYRALIQAASPLRR